MKLSKLSTVGCRIALLTLVTSISYSATLTLSVARTAPAQKTALAAKKACPLAITSFTTPRSIKPAAIEDVNGAQSDGSKLHDSLALLIEQDDSKLRDILSEAKFASWPMSRVISSVILADRRRIVEDLKLKMVEYPAYADWLKKVIAATERRIKSPLAPNEDPTLSELRPPKENDGEDEGDRPKNQDYTYNNPIRKYLRAEWLRNRQFVEELLTALELKNVQYFKEQIRDIMPKTVKTKLPEKLVRVGKVEHLAREVAIVVHDPAHQGYLWVEVRHSPDVIDNLGDPRIASAINKREQVDDFFYSVKEDESLRAAIVTNIIQPFVFRGGGGLEPGVEAQARTRGLRINSVNAINNWVLGR